MNHAQLSFAEPQGAHASTPVRLHAPGPLDAGMRPAASVAWSQRGAACGDPLSDFLGRLHFPGWRCETATLSPGQPLTIEAGCTTVCLVLSGTAAVDIGGQRQQPLERGDLALVSAHATVRPSGSDAVQLPLGVSPVAANHATLLVARFMASGDGHPLAGLLPPYVSSASGDSAGPLANDGFLSWLIAQATSNSPGSNAVVGRFVQSLLVDLLRGFLTSAEGFSTPTATAATGAYQATFDACLGPVMRQVHAAPHRDWTVHSMARESGLSRSAFADRFRTVVGQPPLQYVTEIRMQKAAEMLESTTMPVKRIAAQVGYESVSAFSSAFKRRFGVPPISVRQASATSGSDGASGELQ